MKRGFRVYSVAVLSRLALPRAVVITAAVPEVPLWRNW